MCREVGRESHGAGAFRRASRFHLTMDDTTQEQGAGIRNGAEPDCDEDHGDVASTDARPASGSAYLPAPPSDLTPPYVRRGDCSADSADCDRWKDGEAAVWERAREAWRNGGPSHDASGCGGRFARQSSDAEVEVEQPAAQRESVFLSAASSDVSSHAGNHEQGDPGDLDCRGELAAAEDDEGREAWHSDDASRGAEGVGRRSDFVIPQTPDAEAEQPAEQVEDSCGDAQEDVDDRDSREDWEAAEWEEAREAWHGTSASPEAEGIYNRVDPVVPQGFDAELEQPAEQREAGLDSSSRTDWTSRAIATEGSCGDAQEDVDDRDSREGWEAAEREEAREVWHGPVASHDVARAGRRADPDDPQPSGAEAEQSAVKDEDDCQHAFPVDATLQVVVTEGSCAARQEDVDHCDNREDREVAEWNEETEAWQCEGLSHGAASAGRSAHQVNRQASDTEVEQSAVQREGTSAGTRTCLPDEADEGFVSPAGSAWTSRSFALAGEHAPEPPVASAQPMALVAAAASEMAPALGGGVESSSHRLQPPVSPAQGAWLAEPMSIDEPLVSLDAEATGGGDRKDELASIREELAEARASNKVDRAALEEAQDCIDALRKECGELRGEGEALREQLQDRHGIMAADWAKTLNFQERLKQEEMAKERLAAEAAELRQNILATAEEVRALREAAAHWHLLTRPEIMGDASSSELEKVLETIIPAMARLSAETQQRNRAARMQLHSELEQQLCVVCKDRRKTVLFMPCSHICVCETCRSRLHPYRCPMCQEKVQSFVARVHF